MPPVFARRDIIASFNHFFITYLHHKLSPHSYSQHIQQQTHPTDLITTYFMVDIEWSKDVETIIDSIRKNCIILSDLHKNNYLYFKNILQYFRLPVIIISAVNSIVSVGLQSYMPQSMISITTCGLSLVSGIICSVELFYDIQKLVDVEFTQYKEYNLLSLDIFKILQLDRKRRPLPQSEYLNKVYTQYTRLIENSRIVHNIENNGT